MTQIKSKSIHPSFLSPESKDPSLRSTTQRTVLTNSTITTSLSALSSAMYRSPSYHSPKLKIGVVSKGRQVEWFSTIHTFFFPLSTPPILSYHITSVCGHARCKPQALPHRIKSSSEPTNPLRESGHPHLRDFQSSRKLTLPFEFLGARVCSGHSNHSSIDQSFDCAQLRFYPIFFLCSCPFLKKAELVLFRGL